MKNLVALQQAKHIEIDVHRVHHKILQKELHLDRIDRKLNVIDLFTKLVIGELFCTFKEMGDDQHTCIHKVRKK